MAQIKFNFEGQPIASRVHVVAPIVNSMIEEHEQGSSIGVEAFQHELTTKIREAGLMEKSSRLKKLGSTQTTAKIHACTHRCP